MGIPTARGSTELGAAVFQSTPEGHEASGPRVEDDAARKRAA